jgi:TRAP-type C4-dicarboxylate transport system permease small subunit
MNKTVRVSTIVNVFGGVLDMFFGGVLLILAYELITGGISAPSTIQGIALGWAVAELFGNGWKQVFKE